MSSSVSSAKHSSNPPGGSISENPTSFSEKTKQKPFTSQNLTHKHKRNDVTYQHEWWHIAPFVAAPGSTSRLLWTSTASQGVCCIHCPLSLTLALSLSLFLTAPPRLLFTPFLSGHFPFLIAYPGFAFALVENAISLLLLLLVSSLDY